LRFVAAAMVVACHLPPLFAGATATMPSLALQSASSVGAAGSISSSFSPGS